MFWNGGNGLIENPFLGWNTLISLEMWFFFVSNLCQEYSSYSQNNYKILTSFMKNNQRYNRLRYCRTNCYFDHPFEHLLAKIWARDHLLFVWLQKWKPITNLLCGKYFLNIVSKYLGDKWRKRYFIRNYRV